MVKKDKKKKYTKIKRNNRKKTYKRGGMPKRIAPVRIFDKNVRIFDKNAMITSEMYKEILAKFREEMYEEKLAKFREENNIVQLESDILRKKKEKLRKQGQFTRDLINQLKSDRGNHNLIPEDYASFNAYLRKGSHVPKPESESESAAPSAIPGGARPYKLTKKKKTIKKHNKKTKRKLK
jgi:hypothetical protein